MAGESKEAQEVRHVATLRRTATSNPTSSYVPSGSGAGWGWGMAALDGKPFYSWYDIPRMIRDPRVRFLERMWRSPFQQVTWTIKATHPAVQAYVDHQLRRFWRESLPALLSRYFWFGFAPGGAEFARRRGLVRLDGVRPIEPFDARPLMFSEGCNKGRMAGLTFQSTKVYLPHAFWFAGEKRFGPFYDMPPAGGMFEPWAEKRGRNGAIDMRRTWFRKNAGRGVVVRHPPGRTEASDDFPNGRDNQSLAREMLDYSETNSSFTFTNELHPADATKYAWDVQFPESFPDRAGFREYPKDLDAEMAEGVGIPREVLEAAATGSGYSGRQIPLQAWLGGVDEYVGMLLRACEWLKWAVMINFGPNAYFEVEPESLVKKLLDDAKGPGGMGGAVQNMVDPPKDGGGGGQIPPGMIPHKGKRGGNGYENPESGRVTYLSDGRFDHLTKRIQKILRRKERERRAALELSDGRTQPDPKVRRNTLLILLAMVDFQRRAHAVGDRDSSQPYLAELSKLLANPGAMQYPLQLSWRADETKTGHIRAVGEAEHAGRVLYGARAEAALRNQNRLRDGLKPGEKASRIPEPHPNRDQWQKAGQRAREILAKVANETHSADDLKELAQHLPYLPVDRLGTARSILRFKLKAARGRLAQVDALMDHIRDKVGVLNQKPAEEQKIAEAVGDAAPVHPLDYLAVNHGNAEAMAGKKQDLAIHDAITAAHRGDLGPEMKEAVGKGDRWENYEGDIARRFAAIGKAVAESRQKTKESPAAPKQPSEESSNNAPPAKSDQPDADGDRILNHLAMHGSPSFKDQEHPRYNDIYAAVEKGRENVASRFSRVNLAMQSILDPADDHGLIGSSKSMSRHMEELLGKAKNGEKLPNRGIHGDADGGLMPPGRGMRSHEATAAVKKRAKQIADATGRPVVPLFVKDDQDVPKGWAFVESPVDLPAGKDIGSTMLGHQLDISQSADFGSVAQPATKSPTLLPYDPVHDAGTLAAAKAAYKKDDTPAPQEPPKKPEDSAPQAEADDWNDGTVKKLKEKKTAAPPKTDTLYAHVIHHGGIDPKSLAFLAHYSGVSHAVEDGIPRRVFKNGGEGLDVIVKQMMSAGHISGEDHAEATENLLEGLKTRGYSLHADRTKDHEAALDEHYRKLQEAHDAGHDQSEIDAAVRVGEEAGHREAEDGAGGEGSEGDGHAPRGLQGTSGEDDEVGDTSFDFGGNAEADEFTSKPADPYSAASTDHTEAVRAVPEGQLGWVAGHRVRNLGDGQFQTESKKAYQTGTAEEIADRIRLNWRDHSADKGQATSALDRAAAFTEPDWTDADANAKVAAKKDAIPDGTRAVSLDENTRGRTGAVKIATDDEGKRSVKLVLDGGTDTTATDFEPLDSKHSWRSGEADEPVEGFEVPKPVAKTGDMFGDAKHAKASPELRQFNDELNDNFRVGGGSRIVHGGPDAVEHIATKFHAKPLHAGDVFASQLKKQADEHEVPWATVENAAKGGSENDKRNLSVLARAAWKDTAKQINDDEGRLVVHGLDDLHKYGIEDPLNDLHGSAVRGTDRKGDSMAVVLPEGSPVKIPHGRTAAKFPSESAAKPSEFDPAQAIKIAADDVSKLRKPDVFRVLDWAPAEHRLAVATHVKEARPDLAGEVDEVMGELDEPAPAKPAKSDHYTSNGLPYRDGGKLAVDKLDDSHLPAIDKRIDALKESADSARAAAEQHDERDPFAAGDKRQRAEEFDGQRDELEKARDRIKPPKSLKDADSLAPVPFPAGDRDIVAGLKDQHPPASRKEHPVQDVPVASLRGTQEHIDPEKVAGMQKQDAGDLPPMDVVRDAEGLHHVEDGHHRGAAAHANGDATVPARVWVKDGDGHKLAEPARPAKPATIPGEKPAAPPKAEPGTPTADPVQHPTTPVAEAVEKAEKKGSPRDIAKAADKANDPDFEFARVSAIPNAGEDLKGSARHKVNAWKGLAEAEKDGTAATMVKRDMLLKAEPHNLMANITPVNAIASLAAHVSLNAFPAEPGDYSFRNNPKHAELVKATPEKLREQYLDAYRRVKAEAEQASQTESDPQKVIDRIHRLTGNLISEFRGMPSGDHSSIAQTRATDRYNPVANSLVDLHNRTASKWRPKATDVITRVKDFAGRVQKAYPGDPSPEMLHKIQQHVQDVMEGDSFNKTFGTVDGGKKGFDPASLYVKHAKRTGGRTIDASTVKAGTEYVTKNIGMRGLQWGNSVTDDERQHHLAHTAGALADLADVTGLPDSAMSLGGTMGLAIGARGKGAAMAHYEPDSKVINLTRKNGVGTLAHEWGHALDHWLAGGGIISTGDKRDADYMSERLSAQRFTKDEKGNYKTDAKGNPVTESHAADPVWSAMDDLRKAMKSSGFAQRSNSAVNEAERNGEISKGKRAYWNSTRERFARCFEKHVIHKLKADGRENTYLSGIDPHGFWPSEEEVAHMAPAFDALLAAVKAKHFAGA